MFSVLKKKGETEKKREKKSKNLNLVLKVLIMDSKQNN